MVNNTYWPCERREHDIWTFIGHLWGAHGHLRAYMHHAMAISYSFLLSFDGSCHTQTLWLLLPHPLVIHPLQCHQIIMYDLSLLFLFSLSFIIHVICEDSSPSYACINQGHLVLYNLLLLGYIFPPVNYSLKSWNWLHYSLQDIGCTAISYWIIY